MISKIYTHPDRCLFIDYLRTFLIVGVIVEQSLLPYTSHFKKIAYISDHDDHLLFDICYLCIDAIIMPLLLLISGLFVLPSLKQRGFWNFTQKKLYRLAVPFIFGIIFLVPLQTYPKYILTKDNSINYFYYYQNIFLFDDLSSGGFWFLGLLFFLTFFTVFLYYTIPSFINVLGIYVRWLTLVPIRGFIIFSITSAILLGISDLMWGPFQWIGGGKVFYVRGSRLLLKFFFFFIGVGITESALIYDKSFLKKTSNKWLEWMFLSVFIGGVYILYSLSFYGKGAYNYELIKHFNGGGAWNKAFSVFLTFSPFVLIRTTLLAFFIASLTGLLFAGFYKFFNFSSSLGKSLATCSFGVYIVHEPIQVWLTYIFYHTNVNPLVKFISTASISFLASWFFIRYIFLNFSGFKNAIRPAAKVDFKDAEKMPRTWKYNYFFNCRKPIFEINDSSNNVKL